MNGKHLALKTLDRKWFILGAVALICVIAIVCAILLLGNDGKNDGGTLDTSNPEGAATTTTTTTTTTKNDPYTIAPESNIYFIGEAAPELSKDGLTALVNEMYYTKGGYISVKMTICNGTEEALDVNTIDICIQNAYTEVVTTDCRVTNVPQNIKVPAGGTATCQVYIEPSQLEVKDDQFEAPIIDVIINKQADAE